MAKKKHKKVKVTVWLTDSNPPVVEIVEKGKK